MQQGRFCELQGASTPQTLRTPRTPQGGVSPWSSRLRVKMATRCPVRGPGSWTWLMLLMGGSLLVPGAWSFLSEEQEELLVELHNHYRGQVSPSASAMLPLKWDASLKVLAEGYAAKCIWNHNPELEDTGENLFAGTGPLDLRVAMEKWFMERLDYDFHNNSCDEDKMCGHYTQMVWADTHRVGCAFHLCNTMEGLDWKRASFLVCNYFPAGNYEDERPYVEGDSCSRCPERFQNCQNNLCVPDLVEDEPEDNVTASPPSQTPGATPAGTEDPTVQPASSDRTPSIIKVLLTERPEDRDATTSRTTPESVHIPQDSSPTPRSTKEEREEEKRKEEREEEERKEEKEEKKEKKREEEKREESIIRKEETWEISKPVAKPSAGFVSTASVQLTCLTGLLTGLLTL